MPGLNAHPETVQALLHCGADIHHQDNRGRIPLHLALTRLWDSTGDVRIPSTVNIILNAGSKLEIRDEQGFSPANTAVLSQDVESLAALMNLGSNIVYPPDLGPSSNGYCMLAWPLRKGWNVVSMFLLRRPDVNLQDRDPRTYESVLHLVARYGDQRLLVAFEESVELADFNSQGVDSSNLRAIDHFNDRQENLKLLQLLSMACSAELTSCKQKFHQGIRNLMDRMSFAMPLNGLLAWRMQFQYFHAQTRLA